VEVIVLCGPMGAGKSTAARHLESVLDAQVLSFTSAVFRPVLVALDIEPGREAYQNVGEWLMKWPGEEQLVAALLSHWDPLRRVILDDVRYSRTLELVRSAASGKAMTLFLDCPGAVRYERLRRRDGVASAEEFNDAMSRSTELDVENLRAAAEHVITNDRSLEEFQAALGRIAASLP
jgi:dephospho-CoA kinase